MLGTVAQAAVALIAQIMPYISAGTAAAPVIEKIIGMLEAIVPFLYQEAKDLVPTVKNFIATMRGSDVITKDQLDALDVIEAKVDADCDAASAAAKAEDAAADAAGGD